MEDEKTHWKKNFNYDYLGAYSLNSNEQVNLTIVDVKKQLVTSIGGQKEDCTVAYFKESVNNENKPMILNKTNCKTIEKLYGTPYIEEWKGKNVTIFVQENIKAFGELVDALRIKAKVPILNKPELNSKSSNWEAAKKAVNNENATIESIRKHYSITNENYNLLCG